MLLGPHDVGVYINFSLKYAHIHSSGPIVQIVRALFCITRLITNVPFTVARVVHLCVIKIENEETISI